MGVMLILLATQQTLSVLVVDVLYIFNATKCFQVQKSTSVYCDCWSEGPVSQQSQTVILPCSLKFTHFLSSVES